MEVSQGSLTPSITMSCFSWNCRRLGSPHAIRDLKALIRFHKSDIVFLIEAQLLHKRFPFLKNQLGFLNGFMVERVSFGGGLIMLWRERFDVSLQSFSTGHIDIWIENWLSGGGCYVTRFYGHWNTSL